MSAMVHPIAFLCILKVSINLPSWDASSLEEIIIGKVSFSPKNAYFKFDGKGLRSSLGAWTLDRTGALADGKSFSNSGFQKCLSCT